MSGAFLASVFLSASEGVKRQHRGQSRKKYPPATARNKNTKEKNMMASGRGPSISPRATSTANSSSSSSSSSIVRHGGQSSTSSSLLSPFSPSPSAGDAPSERSCQKVAWHDSDAASPPSREKTWTPRAVERRSPGFDTAPRLSSSCDSKFESTGRYALQPSQAAAASGEAVASVEVSSSSQMKKEGSGGQWMAAVPRCDGSDEVANRAAQRHWARSLQLCLLETKAELQEVRAVADARQQKILAASIEMERLREVTSSQNRRIEELEQSLSQARLSISGRNDNASPPMTADEATEIVESLDGLSVSIIKEAVHGAVEALRRMEIRFEAEKRRRRDLERENDALREQLLSSRRVVKDKEDGRNKRPASCCEEAHDRAMAFLQGPLQRFLAESAEIRELLGMSSAWGREGVQS